MAANGWVATKPQYKMIKTITFAKYEASSFEEYHSWSKNVECKLKAFHLEHHLVAEIIPAPGNDAPSKNLHINQVQNHAFIQLQFINSCINKVSDQIKGAETPKEVWNKLKEKMKLVTEEDAKMVKEKI